MTGLPTTAAATNTPAAAPAGPVITTIRGDSLWALAQTHLGNGMRWGEIVDLNANRTQPDGSHLSRTDTTLPIGFTLQLPTDAVNVPTAAPAPGPTGGDTQVVVAPGDTLHALAEEYLHDPSGARVLFDASTNITQPDGDHLTDPDLIRPGWTIEVPATSPAAVAPAPVAPPAVPPATTDPAPAPPSAVVPAPSTDAATSSPSTSSPATTTPATPSTVSTTAGAVLPPVGSGSTVPDTSPTTAGATTPGPTTSTTTAPSTAGSDSAAPDTASPSVRPLVTASSWMSLNPYTEFGGLLAAGVLAALGTRHVIQARRRRPGNRLVGASSVSPMELALRATEEAPTVAILDAALRTWSARSGGKPDDLPDLLGAVIGTRLTLLLNEPAPASDPFLPGATDTEWVLDPTAVLNTDRDVVAPFPTLVTLGVSPAGELVLLDLERAGAMTFTGAHDDVVDVLSAMAIELALSGWADHLDVTLVGLSHQLVTHLGGGRLRQVDTLEEVLDRLERHHRDGTDALGSTSADSAVAARVAGVAEAVWTPEIVLTAEPVTATERARLAQITDSGAGLNLAAVITAAGSDTSLAGVGDAPEDTVLPGPQIRVPDHGPTAIPVLHTTVTLQRLALVDREALLADFAATDSAEQVPGPDAHLIPAEPTKVVGPPPDPAPLVTAIAGAGANEMPPSGDGGGEDTADSAELATLLHVDPASPEVQVLGPVEVTGREPLRTPGASKVLELAVYLALNPGRSAVEVSTELGPEGIPWKDGTRQSRTSQLRTWLGADSTGADYVPAVTTARGYRLAPTVRTDWRRFQTLATRGLRSSGDGLVFLDAALGLVRGVPFASAPFGAYRFALIERQEMINRIVDVAHAAAMGHLTGNLRPARTAVLQGLRADPVSELLYRDLFRIEYAAGDLPAVRSAARELRRVLENVEISQTTEDLLVELLDPQVRAARRAAR